jgi:hypothetical protein
LYKAPCLHKIDILDHEIIKAFLKLSSRLYLTHQNLRDMEIYVAERINS